MDLRTFIGGREISRDQILEWELQRARRVLRQLGVHPEGSNLVQLRWQLTARKRELGTEGLLLCLRRDLAFSVPFANLTARLSAGRRRFSCIEIVSSVGSAEHFCSWFQEQSRLDDHSVMVAATPDHFILRTLEDGRQEVVETNGGSPLAAQFFIDYGDLSSLRSKRDPDYPLELAGVARSSGGLALGGVRHQFRNEGTGFRARLLVEFPFLILPTVVSGHRWHLASEFGYWIEAALS